MKDKEQTNKKFNEIESILEELGPNFRWLKYNHHRKMFMAQSRSQKFKNKDLRIWGKTATEALRVLNNLIKNEVESDIELKTNQI